MRRFLAACLLLVLAGCGDKAKDLYDTAQFSILPRVFHGKVSRLVPRG